MLIEFVFLLFAAVCIYGMGHYLVPLINNKPKYLNRVFNPIEKFLFKVGGVDLKKMTWKSYFSSLFVTNMLLAFIGFLILMVQNLLVKGMNPILALNTVISFITNTNLQHYAGEVSLTALSQMFVIITMMFVSAASGIAVSFAFIRGLVGKEEGMGNFYVDLVRVSVRVLLPLSFIFGLVLVSQGVPATLKSSLEFTSVMGVKEKLYLGPVAALEAIKHLGTNGGGFFAANSAMPFENPNLITNMLEMLSMMLIPGGILLGFGEVLRHKRNEKKSIVGKESRNLLGVALIFFFVLLAVLVVSELKGIPLLSKLGLSSTMNMEGKELRFGIVQSSLFSTISSAFTTGSVNTMQDSLTPMGGFVPMLLMMMNVVFGGSGVGFMNLMMYVLLTVFICGLMIGKTPEYLSKRIESQEMKRVAMVIIIHPLLILGFSALALTLLGGSGSHHSLSQVLYEFTSASANNGSGFEGLHDATLFYNLSTGLVMFVARYLTMYLQLSVAGMLMKKRAIAQSSGTLHTSSLTFGVALFVIIVVFSALTFFPVLILGPISEHLGLWM